MKTYTIHLLRHGLTNENIEGRYIGITDSNLSEDGLEQLASLKEKYNYKNPQLVFSSPLNRCKQTITKIFGDTEIITVDGLKECNMGTFEGKTAKELEGLPEFNDWVQKGVAPPNGENNRDFATRVCTAFVQTVREILKSGKTESVICTHGGVIMIILAVYGLPQQNMTEWMTNSGQGFTIRITPGVWMRTGMVEVVSEYPEDNTIESDLSDNEADIENNFDDDYDEESTDVFWSDIEDE